MIKHSTLDTTKEENLITNSTGLVYHSYRGILLVSYLKDSWGGGGEMTHKDVFGISLLIGLVGSSSC